SSDITTATTSTTVDTTRGNIPETLITQTPTVEPEEPATSTSTGVPTNLPKLITPTGGIPRPTGIMIKIGFEYPLNYPFVVQTPVAAAQIFDFLPKGIAYGIDIDPSKVKMRNLAPYDSQKA